MRLIERHHVSDKAFRVVNWNNFPAFRRRVGTGELQSIHGTCVTDAALFVKETISRHVRIDVDAAWRIKVHMMPGGGIHRWISNCLHRPAHASRPADRPRANRAYRHRTRLGLTPR